MPSPFTAYLAGIATVIVSLGAGFAGGAILGASWGPRERPAVAKVEHQTTALAPRREIALVRQARPVDAQFSADQAEARKAEKLAEARGAAEQRKAAAAARRHARAERREAERQRQQALILVRQREQQAAVPVAAPALGFAPVASSAPPSKQN